MNERAANKTFRKFLTERTGKAWSWLPNAALRRIRTMKAGKNPEERTEARLIRMAEEKNLELFNVVCPVALVTIIISIVLCGGLLGPVLMPAVMLGTILLGGAGVIPAVMAGDSIKKIVKGEAPLLMHENEVYPDLKEMRRLVLAEERLAETGFTREEIKRLNAALVASSIAREAGLSVTPGEEVLSLFERSRGSGLRLPTSSRAAGVGEERESLLTTLRSAGVETARA